VYRPIATESTVNLTSPATVAVADDVTLRADVATALETATGEVQFFANGNLLGDPIRLDGAATAVTQFDASAYTGMSVSFTAEYSGDDFNLEATSNTVPVALYLSGTVEGTVVVDGVPRTAQSVFLLDAADGSGTAFASAVGIDGRYSLTVPVATPGDALARYILAARLSDGTVLYQNANNINGGSNYVDPDSAAVTGPFAWNGESTNFYYTTRIDWLDNNVKAFDYRVYYSDSVSTVGGARPTFSISSGSLPFGVRLDVETGEISGTPSAYGEYSFVITATNNLGSVSQQVDGEIIDRSIPVWFDASLESGQVGVAYRGYVAATVAPSEGYSVTSGALPAGLSLDSVSGAVTGTPTTAGTFAFTLTATNAYGSVSRGFSVVIAPAPVVVPPAPNVELAADFRPGTPLEDASATVTASNLLPGSTYSVTLFSEPVVLASGVVGASGTLSLTVALPAYIEPGAHRLVFAGTSARGAALTSTVWFSVLANLTIGEVSYAGPVTIAAPVIIPAETPVVTGPVTGPRADALAATGVDVTLLASLAGILLVAGAFGLLGRRRSRGTHS